MALVLTEKVKGDLGGTMFKVFKVTGVTSTTAQLISLDAIGMNYIHHAKVSWNKCTLTSASTTPPALKSYTDKQITLSGIIGSGVGVDSLTLTVYGN